MARKSSKRPTDKLSSLPPEVLANIFEQLYGEKTLVTAPLCRYLWPQQQYWLYRHIRIKNSYTRFSQLSNAITANPALTKKTISLYVRLDDEEPDFEYCLRHLEGDVPQEFIRSFKNLKRMELYGAGSTDILPILLLPKLAPNRQTKLEYLTITAHREHFDFFDGETLRALKKYPKLKDLTLYARFTNHHKIYSKEDDPWGDRQPRKPLPTFPSITSLTINASRFGCDQTRYLLESFPSIRHLTLKCKMRSNPSYEYAGGFSFSSDDEEGKALRRKPVVPIDPFSKLLPHLPSKLKSLSMIRKAKKPSAYPAPRSFTSRYATPPTPNHPLLHLEIPTSDFHRLRYLYIGGNSTLDPTLKLNKQLRKLPLLNTLGFGYKSNPTPKQLLELIEGSNRLPRLSRLILDQFRGKIGSRVDIINGKGLHKKAYRGRGNKKDRVAPDWVVPNLKLEDVEELEKVFEKLRQQKGFRVEGTSFKAMSVWKEFQKEKIDCEIVWAFESGDFEGLIELKGEEFVEELKKERNYDELEVKPEIHSDQEGGEEEADQDVDVDVGDGFEFSDDSEHEEEEEEGEDGVSFVGEFSDSERESDYLDSASEGGYCTGMYNSEDEEAAANGAW